MWKGAVKRSSNADPVPGADAISDLTESQQVVLRQLLEMGFTPRVCKKACMKKDSLERALEWALKHSENTEVQVPADSRVEATDSTCAVRYTFPPLLPFRNADELYNRDDDDDDDDEDDDEDDDDDDSDDEDDSDDDEDEDDEDDDDDDDVYGFDNDFSIRYCNDDDDDDDDDDNDDDNDDDEDEDED